MSRAAHAVARQLCPILLRHTLFTLERADSLIIGGTVDQPGLGTPAQAANALLDYYDLGVGTFLIRGFDPLEATIQYGGELIPLVREAVANRPATGIAA